MITGITLGSLRNSEFTQFMADVLKIVSANDPAKLNVTDKYTAFAAASNQLESIFKTERGSVITDAIIALDARRDDAITGITTLVNAFIYHFDAAIRNHAGLLVNHLGQYGSGIARESYQSETAIINNIVADWTNKPELAKAVDALHLADWKKELETANNTFNEQYLTRTRQMGAATTDTSMKDIRLTTATAYYELRDFIISYGTINKLAEPYKKTINELNALIDQYNALLASHKSKATTPTPPVTPAAA